jgi:photosystem II stability/assembly factor-like uncharacterized protein
MRHTTLFIWLATASFVPATEPAGPFDNLKFRNIGPAAGGRVSRACGVPGNPLVYYAATAGGGVWKSSDGGLKWNCVTDDLPDSSFGSVAVAPSDPNVVYAGAGEANIRGNVAAGHGIYKSTDAGQSWKKVWDNLGQIGTLIVHPTNPDVAFAAVLGSPFGPGKERGVYRTTDGGKTWKQVLARDEDTGASDVCFDPNNPRILFAGLWQARRRPWEMTSGGPGSGLYTSRDGGDTWTQLKPETAGLPKGPWGKIGVAVAPSDSNRVYALIEANDGGLFRSDDGGTTWSLASDDRLIRQRAFYYTTLTVDPTNADVVYAPNVPLLRSIDGGKSFSAVRGSHHGDYHDIWIDPRNPKRMINSNDGGVDISHDGGKTWTAPPLPIAQFYHISADNAVPYRVMGNMQDLGTAAGPHRGLAGGRVRLQDWATVGGGETGFSVADPSDPDIVYAGEYGGLLTRFDRRTGQAKNVSPFPINPSGITPAELKYRFQWTSPVLISTHDPKTVYHAGNVIFRTTDGGQTWTAISGDLTRNDKRKQQWSGGPITGDNTGVEIYGTVFALAESPRQAGVLWAGSDDGLIHVSRDAGATWTNVSANVPGLPDWATVRAIEPGPAPGEAYLVVDAHRLNDFRPYLWKTTDFGATWTRLGTDLPQDVYLHVVRADRVRPGLLFAGTERGVHYSTDDGKTFAPLKAGLPTVAVHDIVIKDNDLVVGTMGRSIWILDDITPLRELTAAVAEQPVHLFTPAPVVRWRSAGGFSFDGQGAAPNPPDGAVIHYRLKKRPANPIRLAVVDAAGKELFASVSKPGKDDRKKGDADEDDDPPAIDLSTDPGLHRVVWNLRTDAPDHIPGAKVDSGNPKVGVLVPPGNYSVKLTVDGQTLTQPLSVRPDPRAKVDTVAQFDLAMTIRDELTRLSRTVKQLRAVRKQIEARDALTAGEKRCDELRAAGRELLRKLDTLEEKLHNPKAKVPYDIFGPPGGAKLYSQLIWVYNTLQDADGPPTRQLEAVASENSALLKALVREWEELVAGDLAKLNESAKKLDLPTVYVPPTRSGG